MYVVLKKDIIFWINEYMQSPFLYVILVSIYFRFRIEFVDIYYYFREFRDELGKSLFE